MNLTSLQLFLLAIITGLLAATTSISFGLYREYSELPLVVKNSALECVKVVNFKNGHAFNCNDVNVLLRQYRSMIE